MGRPSKYKPEFCEKVQDMLKEGASLTEFCADIGITRETLRVWREDKPDFSDALTHAEIQGQAYWERKLRTELMLDNKANSALVKLYFANRFGWSDKNQQEVTGPNGSALNLTVNFVQPES